jgi:hypothetical protein
MYIYIHFNKNDHILYYIVMFMYIGTPIMGSISRVVPNTHRSGQCCVQAAWVSTYIYIYLYVLIHVCIYSCIYIYICIYLHIHMNVY